MSFRTCAWIMLVITAVSGHRLAAQSSTAFRFAWAVVSCDVHGATAPIDYDKDVVDLESGTAFRILLKPLTDCRAYLYLHDAQRALRLVFPPRLDSTATGARVDGIYRLPAEDGWYRLDEHGGTEVFYLIVSRARLPDLEARTLAHLAQKRKGRKAEEAKQRLLREIRGLVNESSPLRGSAERPAVVAGDFRGVRDEVSGRIVEADGVYVATIRLRH